MGSKFNLAFRHYPEPRSCGIYNQNTLIGLIQSAFLQVEPNLLLQHPGADLMEIWCGWDDSMSDTAFCNQSRLYYDRHYYKDRLRSLSQQLSNAGARAVASHTRTANHHRSGRIVGVSLFDINGTNVDAYVKSILTSPDWWLNALIPLSETTTTRFAQSFVL